jgi:hypothetical protein
MHIRHSKKTTAINEMRKFKKSEKIEEKDAKE